jgi:protoheme IX farnesyltransferase
MSTSPSHAELPVDAVGTPAVDSRRRGADFLALTKPRLNFLVVLTTAAAYSLGSRPEATFIDLLHTLVGTFLVAAGASAFNQVWERDVDRLMRRTRTRPLPDLRLRPRDAVAFGVVLTAAGAVELGVFVNRLSSLIALLTCATYIFFYTPLKVRTSLSTLAGAVPGALPAAIGWAAATNTLSIEAWVLFAIVFMWQMPHFLAIAWMYRDEYATAGIRLLPVVEPSGRSTGRQVVLYTAALLPVSFLPVAVGLATAWYLAGAIALGGILMVLAVEFSNTRSLDAARRLFLGSILYLPLLWAILVGDHIVHLT